MTNKERVKLGIISAYMGTELTEEQMEFASDFTRNMISFSDPGTGKTHTVVAGLLMAQAYHEVPGNLINCMSFTNAAVNELANRYKKMCKRSSLSASVVFNTFHRFSNVILRSAYPTMTLQDFNDIERDCDDMIRYMNEVGLERADNDYAKKTIKVINSLNSALCFHPANVENHFEFLQLKMDVDIFQELRKKWFTRGIMNDVIMRGDIPLYCLYALMSKPKLVEAWKGRYKIMVVDEFQDLSLLHLQILSYVAETLIVIGDMKQQIYHFNGACPQIVQEYFKLRPDAISCNLTRSFRCRDEIANFACKVIEPNDPSIKYFTGKGAGGSVDVIDRHNLKWDVIAETIADDVKKNHLAGARDIMFLYRNNASAIPIIDELYKRGIPYRCSRFAKVMDVPVFKELCTLANVAWQPNDIKFVTAALKLFPEFKNQSYGSDYAPVLAMQKTGKNFFEIPFKYRDESSNALLNAMFIARKKIEAGASAGVVLNNLIDVYSKYIIRQQWWRLDNTLEFYTYLVAPICNSKKYPVMYNEEIDKEAKNKKNIEASMGVRCYTMHSAKGLEADEVYILDCDDGIFPNPKVLKNKLDAHCYYDAACDVRSERNLLFVAITRAKDAVHISYSGDAPTELIREPFSARYSDLDEYYRDHQVDYDDANEFFKLFRLREYKIKHD